METIGTPIAFRAPPVPKRGRDIPQPVSSQGMCLSGDPPPPVDRSKYRHYENISFAICATHGRRD